MYRIAIVGAGKGGKSLLEIFSRHKDMTIVGIFDQFPDAVGFALANELNIPTWCDISQISSLDVDIVVNVTGAYKITREIEKHVSSDVEVISNKSARVIWELIVAREELLAQMERNNNALTFLYEIGILLARSDSSEIAVQTTLDRSLELTGAPAGSVAVYHAEKNEMESFCLKGFSEEFQTTPRWAVREGGITEYIIKQNKPVVIDKKQLETTVADNSLVNEGIQTVLAVPLTDRGEVIGILYNDFREERNFDEEELRIVDLFANKAATAIKQVKETEFQEQLAITDGLTSLYNHRYFKLSLEREMKKSTEMGHHVSLLLMDLDHFKAYNDNFGHLAGDEILREVSRIVRESVRAMDIPARYGGEEFAVILPGTNKHDAENVAEKIRKKIEENAFSAGSNQSINHNVTVSIGVCTYPDSADDMQDFIEKADLALYLSKKGGRNQVNSYTVTTCAKS